MKMLILLSLACCVIPISCIDQGPGSEYPSIGNLTMGDHGVGYRSLFLYNTSRSGIPYSDWDGNLYDDHDPAKGRQYQINVWFPAQKNTGSQLNFGHYVHLMGRQTNFDSTPAQEEFAKQRFIDQTNALGGNGNFSAQELDQLLQLSVYARLDATASPGRFPLILFPSGSSPGDQSIMCEYLASHGYVVVAFAPKGRFSFGLEVSTIGLETAVDDLEFVLEKVADLSYVDTDHIALMANAINSSVCILAVSGNDRIKAYISLEGGFPSAFEQRLLDQSVFYHPVHIKIPLLIIYAPHPSIDPKHTYHLKYAKRYYAHFPGMSEFVMLNFGMFDSFIPDIIGPHKGDVQLGYEIANELVLRFLDVHLRDTDIDVFDSSFISKAGPVIDTTFILKALPSPPNIAVLKDLFIKRGMEPIDSIYQDLKKNGNDQPFESSFYTAFRDWLAWQKDPDYTARLKLYELASDSYPKSADVNYYLAYFLQRTGKTQQAITAYQNTISLLDRNTDKTLSPEDINEIRHFSKEALKSLR